MGIQPTRGTNNTHTTPDFVRNYTYDTANQITQTSTLHTNTTSPQIRNFTYDAAGNLTSDGKRQYEWDLSGNLTKTINNTHEWTYTYNGEKQRTQSTQTILATQTTTNNNYSWDNHTPYANYPLLTQSNQNGTNTNHTYHPGGSVNGFYSTDTTYATTDALGSVTAQTNTYGETLTSQDYDPYGQKRGPPGAETTLGYNSQQTDPSGLLYLRARYYDPELGLFLSPDPLGGAQDALLGQNPYGYANSSPLYYTDPTGEFGIPDFIKDGASAVKSGAKKAGLKVASTVSNIPWNSIGEGAIDFVYKPEKRNEMVAESVPVVAEVAWQLTPGPDAIGFYEAAENGCYEQAGEHLRWLTLSVVGLGVGGKVAATAGKATKGIANSTAVARPTARETASTTTKYNTKTRTIAVTEAQRLLPKTHLKALEEAVLIGERLIAGAATRGQRDVLPKVITVGYNPDTGKIFSSASGNNDVLPYSVHQKLAAKNLTTNGHNRLPENCGEAGVCGLIASIGDNPSEYVFVSLRREERQRDRGYTTYIGPCANCQYLFEQYGIKEPFLPYRER